MNVKTILVALAAVAVTVLLLKNKSSIFRLNLDGVNAPSTPPLYGGS